MCFFFMLFFFFQAEDGIRDLVRSRGLGDVYKRQVRGNAVAVAVLALAELDMKHADAADEIESVARDVDVSALV